MITSAMLAAYFENALNAIVPTGAGYEFKIWAEAGEFKKYYRQGNNIVYYINGLLSVNGSALTPNALIMGTNGVTIEFLVPADEPKTSYDQPDDNFERIQNGQFYFIQQVSELLLNYFTSSKKLTMTDDKGVLFNMTAYSGVGISGVIDIKTIVGMAMPMTVSITLNFGEELISGLDIKVYIDGEIVPYLTLTPSRTGQLSTDLQSNTTVQKHLSTSSAYGLQFTCPAAENNKGAKAIYDYIADKTKVNTAHFIEVRWGNARTDVYFGVLTSANANVSGAEFAGINAVFGEAYQNEELLIYPEEYGTGYFETASSLNSELIFTIKTTFQKTFARGKSYPDHYPLYYEISGTTYKLDCAIIASGTDAYGNSVITYAGTDGVSIVLTPSDFIPDEEVYRVYLISSQAVTVTVSAATPAFAYHNGEEQ